MSKYCAVLLDTISIQKYVFGSNELRDNIGASKIVNMLFEETVIPALMASCDLNDKEKVMDLMNSWMSNPDEILLEVNDSIPFEIGVKGGGKALIFFREAAQAKSFVKYFTRDLLIKAPGIQVAIAIDDNFSMTNNFAKNLNDLYYLLNQNRNKFFPITSLPNHGITAICLRTNASFNFIDEKSQDKYISAEKMIKQTYAKQEEDELNKKLQEKYSAYIFSNRVDYLGQLEGDNYTAVVHIDGNNMGKWFSQSKDLAEYRKRSARLAKVTKESYDELIAEVDEIMPYLTIENNFNIKKQEEKLVLPIRPLILGGDDFTFICEGRLALYLTELYLKIWTKKANEELSDLGLPENGEFTASAGVAIGKTTYPFYRIYQFAVELCKIAKKEARDAKKGSWLDFHIITGTKSGNLSDIRAEEGKARGLNLHFGPYCVEEDDEKSIKHLKDGILAFQDNWPSKDLKELQKNYYLGKEILESFLISMRAKGLNLPHQGYERYSNDYGETGYFVNNKTTPYFDMLEIMPFYPDFLLRGGVKVEDSNRD